MSKSELDHDGLIKSKFMRDMNSTAHKKRRVNVCALEAIKAILFGLQTHFKRLT